MGFFDLPAAGLQPRWPPRSPHAPPEYELPGLVPVTAVVARDDDTAIVVAGLAAYPSGVEIEVDVRLRADTRPWGDPRLPVGWTAEAARLVRFGVLLGDGRRGHTTVIAVAQTSHPTLPAATPVGHHPPAGRSGPRLTYWLGSLPPAGALTFVADFPARGLAEGRVAIDSEPIREAATRAAELWPPGAPLPRPGTPPDDPDAETDAVRAAFAQAFTGGEPAASALDAVEAGPSLADALARLRSTWPRQTASARVRTGDLVFVSPTEAALWFEVTYEGGPRRGELLGHAVRTDAGWKVAHATYAAVLAWGGAGPPHQFFLHVGEPPGDPPEDPPRPSPFPS